MPGKSSSAAGRDRVDCQAAGSPAKSRLPSPSLPAVSVQSSRVSAARLSSASASGGGASLAEPSTGASSRSSSGLPSSSWSTNTVSSVWESCRSLIACCNCGVITRLCAWRRSSLWVTAMAAAYRPKACIKQRSGQLLELWLSSSKRAQISLYLAPAHAWRICRGARGPAAAGASEAEALAQIDPADALVGHDLLGRALHEHAALVEDVGAVDDLKRLAHVVVGDEHADAAVLEMRHEV